MTKIISIANHKGGVGKTTSVINIGFGISQIEKKAKILLIDLDAQANLTESLNVDNEESNIYLSMRNNTPLVPISVTKNIDVIPSTLDLSSIDLEIANKIARETILKKLLEPIINQYNYILIDNPPAINLLTINAFSVSHAVLIPVQAHYLSLKAVFKLSNTIEDIKTQINPELSVNGIFITQYDSRIKLHQSIANTILEAYPNQFLSTKIRNNVALAEAPTQGKTIYQYDKSSHGAEDYLALTEEYLNRINHLN